MTTETDQTPELPEPEALAAEYALGLLDETQRKIVAERIDRDAAFARLVDRWTGHLSLMNDDFATVQPPAGLKAAIDQRLFSTQTSSSGGFLSSLAFWRALSGAALAGLVAFAVFVNQPTPKAPQGGTFVASLTSKETDVQFVALYDEATETLKVTRVAGEKPSQRDFELWLINDQGKAISLGLVGVDGEKAARLPKDLQPQFKINTTLAVSVEPIGGSPTGQATGPVIALGPVKKI